MNSFALISVLKLTSILTGAAAILCMVPVILIVLKNTPDQLKAIIESERIRNDPRHRKATHWLSPEEKEKLDALLGCPDEAPADWHGHYPGKENRV